MNFLNKIIITAFAALALLGCRKEELNPVKDWEDGATGLGTIEYASAVGANSARGFKANGMDTSRVTVAISWNNYGKDVKINKIVPYVHWVERYYDSTRQQNVEIEHLAPLGKTDASLVINNPKLREKNPITITPEKVYDLFKTTMHKYNGPAAVNVFQNPEIDRSDPKKRFRVGDRFFVTWWLYAEDGRIFKTWAVSIQNGELEGANTRVSWSVIP